MREKTNSPETSPSPSFVRRGIRTLCVFLLAAAWFSLLISWHGFPDPDAFYHAKMALLVWQHGPVMSFPWLDLTTLGKAFADQHFLFHVIESPFVAMLGWATGARVTAIFLSAIFLTTFDRCARWLGFRYAAAWTILLAITPPLLIRTLLGKATPLALALFVVGLAAAWKRKPILAFVIASIFALTHGGWVYLLGSSVLLVIGDVIFSKIVEDRSWRDAIRSSPWNGVVAIFAGVILGTIFHPNYPANVSVLWTQIVTIGLQTPYAHVILGNEWRPIGPLEVLGSLALWVMAFIAGIGATILARRRQIDREVARGAVAFAWPVAILFAFTMKSQRNAEYLVPAVALWIPWIWNLVDLDTLREALARGWSERRQKVTTVILMIMIIAASVKGVWGTWNALATHAQPDNAFASAMAPVSAIAKPGDRVFHSDWDEFPVLFNLDDRLRYVAGLDPTFLYEASSSLSDAYRDLTWHTASSTVRDAWSLIHDRLDARFVFIARADHEPLADLIKTDQRYRLLAQTEDAVTFEVVPAQKSIK